jgi:multidrug efflux system membrane fusion protein
MTKSRALSWLVAVLSVSGVAMATGLLGKPDEVAKWFLPVKWIGGDRTAVRGSAGGASARSVLIEAATAVKKKTPVLIEALGTVTTIASVAIKTRIDNQIVGIHFTDGAHVKQGDLLVTLDGRSFEAQIAQAEANLARDRAQLAGADRDLRRALELTTKGAGPQTNVDNFKTQADMLTAAIKADLAVVENLKVQLSYCTIYAPISGQISQAVVDEGNLVRAADTVPITTINQMAPVYVTFRVAQRSLPDVRAALAQDIASVDVIVPGAQTRRADGVSPLVAHGRITMVENTVDPTTGMATVRATMPNDDELLWPGTLVNVQVTVRIEEAVIVPSSAVQVSQQGPFVFVVRDNIAAATRVKVARLLGAETVIETGIDEGDVVVTDGHLLLTDGARVTSVSLRRERDVTN